MGNCCNSLFWLLLLVFVSWWIATMAFPFYLVTSILAGCIHSLSGLSNFFLHGVQFPGMTQFNLKTILNQNKVFLGFYYTYWLIFS